MEHTKYTKIVTIRKFPAIQQWLHKSQLDHVYTCMQPQIQKPFLQAGTGFTANP